MHSLMPNILKKEKNQHKKWYMILVITVRQRYSLLQIHLSNNTKTKKRQLQSMKTRNIHDAVQHKNP